MTRSHPRRCTVAALVAATAAALSAAALLCGCTVGPSYRGPPAIAGATGRTFVRASPVSGAAVTTGRPMARWWTTLGDPELDHLVTLAVGGSPDVQEAQAKLRSARALLAQQAAGLFPTTGLSGAYVRTRNLTSLLGSGSGGGSGGGMNLYAAGLDASWEADIFGGQRRAIEGARAAAEGSEASLADVLVSVSAEVAQAYVGLRDAQQRLALTQRNLAVESHLVNLYNIRQRAGTASDLDVERIVNQVDTTRATLAPLRAEVDVQLDRLSVLTGQPPGALDAELTRAAATPVPPARVAIGDPVAMLRRRPDIVVAERRLAQQTAAIGQAVAAQFPQVRLLGEVGFASLSPGTLFNGSNFSYIVAPILQWTPWDFGRNRARIAQARAERDAAEAEYRQSVLAALEDAESSLAQYGEARNAVVDLGRARDSAEHVYAMTQIRLHGGTADTTDVLDADTRRIQAELGYEQGLAQLTQDYVTLQKSLGLGWAAGG